MNGPMDQMDVPAPEEMDLVNATLMDLVGNKVAGPTGLCTRARLLTPQLTAP